ncbi:MAG: putative peptidase [Patescibacteria group bacterium]|nr:putative peptidase [Patescibacteria group bacterium]
MAISYDEEVIKHPRILAILICLLCLLAISAIAWNTYAGHRASPAVAPRPHIARTTPTPAPTPALDPLAIAAIASRNYPGSRLATEQELGGQAGYHDQIASYQSDGFKIYALVSVPSGAPPAGGWPVIILEHGYTDPAAYHTNSNDYRQFITAFAQAGYAVIKPDFRGHGSSQGTPEGGHFSPVYTYDVMNLIASLKQDPRFNAKRVGQFAHSLGGHTALRTAVVSKDIKATALMAGVVGSFDDIFYHWPTSPMASDRPAIVQTAKQALIARYGTPQTNPDFWAKASAVNFVSQISGATQVNQDAGDSVVPQIFADHLVDALRKAGKPVDYHLYPGDDHQFIQNRTSLLQNLLAFYKAHL